MNISHKIKSNSVDGDLATNDATNDAKNDSLLDGYAKCTKYAETIPAVMNLNFIIFATKYKVVNQKLSAQAANSIPSVFPAYSSNQILPFTENIGFFDINPGTQHKIILGMTNQPLMKFT